MNWIDRAMLAFIFWAALDRTRALSRFGRWVNDLGPEVITKTQAAEELLGYGRRIAPFDALNCNRCAVEHGTLVDPATVPDLQCTNPNGYRCTIQPVHDFQADNRLGGRRR